MLKAHLFIYDLISLWKAFTKFTSNYCKALEIYFHYHRLEMDIHQYPAVIKQI